MKHPIVLVLAAAAAFAEESALSVRCDFAVEALSEGERTTAIFHLKNVSEEPVVLLVIQPEDDLAMSGGQVSRILEALRVDLDAEKGTLKVETGAVEQVMPRPFPDFVWPALLRPGEERSQEVTFKAPAGHLYAIHFQATYIALGRLLAEGRIFVPDPETATDLSFPTYHCARSAEDFSDEDFDNGGKDVHTHRGTELLARTNGIEEPGVTRAALALEVKPREFSFAQATQAAGVIPDAVTWFESRGLWALSAGGRTFLLAQDYRLELHGDYVPYLTELGLSGETEVHFWAREDDDLAKFLRSGVGTLIEDGRGALRFLAPVRDLPEILQKADELGFVVEQGGWKKRE